ncbi:MAG: radical SAM protein [Anaerolineae bacterium]|nr:radical SAM protein [Anaerolineae bacterium]
MTEDPTTPSYLALHASGELRQRVERAWERLHHCDLCPRACGVDRLAGQVGYCRSGAQPQVASANVHPWEEPPISGTRGSGTIFFSNCTARCRFCQNYPISQLGTGRVVTLERLAEMMLRLQKRGCHNINFVTPTHYVPQILAAVELAVPQGLHLPLLYNTSGYDRPDTLRMLEGVIDIYLPDAKYADEAVAQRLSDFRGYVRWNRAALLEMKRQVGIGLALDAEGLATRGLIVRHMVLPQGLSQTPEVLRWIAELLGCETYVSVMAQYFPAHEAVSDDELCRGLTPEEYEAALDAADALGLEHGWRQELDSD